MPAMKPAFLMITAEGTNRGDDPVHLLEGHTVHGPVQHIKVGSDLFVVQIVDLIVGLIKKRQDGITIPKVWRMRLYLLFQFLDIWIHGHTPPKSLWYVSLESRKLQVLSLPIVYKTFKILRQHPGKYSVERCYNDRGAMHRSTIFLGG